MQIRVARSRAGCGGLARSPGGTGRKTLSCSAVPFILILSTTPSRLIFRSYLGVVSVSFLQEDTNTSISNKSSNSSAAQRDCRNRSAFRHPLKNAYWQARFSLNGRVWRRCGIFCAVWILCGPGQRMHSQIVAMTQQKASCSPLSSRR